MLWVQHHTIDCCARCTSRLIYTASSHRVRHQSSDSGQCNVRYMSGMCWGWTSDSHARTDNKKLHFCRLLLVVSSVTNNSTNTSSQPHPLIHGPGLMLLVANLACGVCTAEWTCWSVSIAMSVTGEGGGIGVNCCLGNCALLS
jgi:hypothetical protein